jgi:hypothetical protein
MGCPAPVFIGEAKGVMGKHVTEGAEISGEVLKV